MGNILGFVIPFKPMAESSNWNLDKLLLKRTIATLLRNDSNTIKIFLVYTDPPGIELNDDRLYLEQYPFKPYNIKDLEDYEIVLKNQYNELYLKRHLDKSRKIMWGCKLAKDAGCHFIMNVDADDLVSNKLITFLLQQNNDLPGWYIPKGYVYYEKTGNLTQVFRNMHLLNGSTHVLNRDLIDVPFDDTKVWGEINLFTDHGYLKERLRITKLVNLIPIPFFSITYCRNGISNISEPNLAKTTAFKIWLKKLLTQKKVTKEIAMDFNLHYESTEIKRLLTI